MFCNFQALASTLNEEELADLKDQFDAIDVDKNGSISLEEMRQVIKLTDCLTTYKLNMDNLSIGDLKEKLSFRLLQRMSLGS